MLLVLFVVVVFVRLLLLFDLLFRLCTFGVSVVYCDLLFGLGFARVTTYFLDTLRTLIAYFVRCVDCFV